jgi:transcriptional regulator with XRE-family HTH domain
MGDSAAQNLARQVGRRIAELRAKQDLTQEQLSERATVGLRYLQRVEAGEENLTLESVAKLAEVLGVHSRELFKPARSRQPGRGRPRKRRPARS